MPIPSPRDPARDLARDEAEALIAWLLATGKLTPQQAAGALACRMRTSLDD